jgi:hypothetical protein
MESAPLVYLAGQKIPRTGVYNVYHYQHRLPHVALLNAEDRFPECKQCGSRVRFELLSGAQPIADDGDFGIAESQAA